MDFAKALDLGSSDAVSPHSPRLQHFDPAGQIDGMIAQAFVEPGQQGDLGANGGGDRLGGDFFRQPLMENVDLLVVFMQSRRSG